LVGSDAFTSALEGHTIHINLLQATGLPFEETPDEQQMTIKLTVGRCRRKVHTKLTGASLFPDCEMSLPFSDQAPTVILSLSFSHSPQVYHMSWAVDPARQAEPATIVADLLPKHRSPTAPAAPCRVTCVLHCLPRDDAPNARPNLRLHLLDARNLAGQRPLIKFLVGPVRAKSSFKPPAATVVWDEVFEFLIEDPTAQTVAVYAADAKGQKESLGQSTLRLGGLALHRPVIHECVLDVPLQGASGSPNGPLRIVRLRLEAFGPPFFESPAVPAEHLSEPPGAAVAFQPPEDDDDQSPRAVPPPAKPIPQQLPGCAQEEWSARPESAARCQCLWRRHRAQKELRRRKEERGARTQAVRSRDEVHQTVPDGAPSPTAFSGPAAAVNFTQESGASNPRPKDTALGRPWRDVLDEYLNKIDPHADLVHIYKQACRTGGVKPNAAAKAVLARVAGTPALLLKDLTFADNYFGDRGMAALCAVLRHVPSLEHLDLRNTHLSTVGLRPLAAVLTGHPALSSLDLHDNVRLFTKEDGELLLRLLQSNRRIRTLRLDGSNLLPTAVRRLQREQVVNEYLSRSPQIGVDVAHLGEALARTQRPPHSSPAPFPISANS